MSTASSSRSRANIEIALFGFLVSLTLKAGLDTAYKDTMARVTSGSELLQTILVPASLLLIVFLITLLRFVYGAYRFNEEAQESPIKLKSWAQLWNISATLVLFVFFYITGLSIQHAKPFYIGLIVVHVWDLIWFVSTVVSLDTIAYNLKRVIQKFILLDLFTILSLVLTMYLFNGHYRGKAAIVMMALAVIDLYWNRNFFFYPEEWRKPNSQTGGTKSMILKRTRLYFAAPLFTQAEWLWNVSLAKKLSEFNMDVVLPQEKAKPMLFGEETFDAAALFAANVEEIEKADVILAILDQPDPDSGTCWECGYAYKTGRPVIGLRTDIRKAGDDPDAGVNLMLSKSCKKILPVPLDKRDDLDWVAHELVELINQI